MFSRLTALTLVQDSLPAELKSELRTFQLVAMQNLFYTGRVGAVAKGDGAHTFFELLHKSGGRKIFSALQGVANDEGDQITTTERPGRGLFRLGEVQTRRGRRVRTPSYFRDFL
jgi:hypothetical protein